MFKNPENYVQLAKVLQYTRSFFSNKGLLELESPLLLSHPNTEAFIDSFAVTRSAMSKRPDLENELDSSSCLERSDTSVGSESRRRYLISSPEFSIKQIMLQLQSFSHSGVFQIAHCFRSGEMGPLHREEFLMLECYLLGVNEFQFMDCFAEFLQSIIYLFRSNQKQINIRQMKLSNIFREYTGDSWTQLRKKADSFLDFEESFQKIMIEKIEDKLGQTDPEFIYHFPAEMAGYSKISSKIDPSESFAHRFELYWKGIELANGYHELTSFTEYETRLRFENSLRLSLGKGQIEPPISLLDSLKEKGPLPESCGIALGLDRFLMLLQNQKTLDTL